MTNRTHREYSVVSGGDSTITWADHVSEDTLVLLSAVARIGEVAHNAHAHSDRAASCA